MILLNMNLRSNKPACTRRERGQDLVEFAIVLPVLLLLTLGIIQFGILIWNYNTVSNAAREGARYAIVKPNADPASGSCTTAPASSILGHTCTLTLGLNPAQVSVTTDRNCTSSGPLGCITVEVEYQADLLLGGFLGLPVSIPLSSSATMDREQ